MAVGHWIMSQNRDSRFSDFFISTMKFLIHILKIWDFGRIGSRPQAQMTMSPIQKTFLVLRPFKRALICSILIEETQVMFRKANFLRRGSWLRPESWTSRPRIQTPRPYHWDAPMDSCLKFQLSRCYTGRKIAHRRTDGRQNDFSWDHFF
jgi:hypothetical protein